MEKTPDSELKLTSPVTTAENFQEISRTGGGFIETNITDVPSHSESPFSVLSRFQKLVVIFLVSIAGVISSFTGFLYLPALNTIADELGVGTFLINLTITSYQIFQGLAPSVIGTLSDVYGRRPAYLLAFGISVIANLALALQDSYPALLVLRCLQSAGSSATIALGSAVVSDMFTRAERGSYIGYTSLGLSMGPALGPVIGGFLNQCLGWRSIFWSLLIVNGVILVIVALLLPETGRAVVGNGSVKPRAWWNLNLSQWLRVKRGQPFNGAGMEEDMSTISVPRHRPNPLTSLRILLEPEGGITLGFGSLLYAGYFMILTTLSEQLEARFGLSSAMIGLYYLPLGYGTLISPSTAGQLFDWNFRRHARRLGLSLDISRQQQIEIFPIERIRLEISIPMIYISCGGVLGYAWAMESNASLTSIGISLLFQSLFFSGALQGLNTLIVETHQDTLASVTAANNLFRCLMSAGGAALAPLLIDRMGVGFMGVFISGVWLCFSPCLWLVLLYGKKWREKHTVF